MNFKYHLSQLNKCKILSENWRTPIALVMMTNSILRTSTFPEIFKIWRILPISKPDKPVNLIDSYRPIKNLPCLEKILEEYILTHLNKYLTENEIIHENHHHGGIYIYSPCGSAWFYTEALIPLGPRQDNHCMEASHVQCNLRMVRNLPILSSVLK